MAFPEQDSRALQDLVDHFAYTGSLEMTTILDLNSMISERAQGIDVSGIRRVFELGAKLKNPINFSIGQPDFDVPESIKQAAIRAIENDQNNYTLTQGIPELLQSISSHLSKDVGWDVPSNELEVMVTSGTSGALLLAMLAVLNPGDEVIMGDPYFVLYPAVAKMAGVNSVYCDTYPDFRLTAARVEPLITDRTKMLLLNSPNNPTGIVLTSSELRDLVDLCARHGIVIVSDEIYDEFTYEDARENGKCPSPARFTDQMLLVRGFGKSYGCTGWRMGYATGPIQIIMQMRKLQQFSFVCAPSMAQAGLVGAFEIDVSSHVAAYKRKRDMVLEAFHGVAHIEHPGGAFYAFVELPSSLRMTASEFTQKAIDQNVLIIPGSVFSEQDSHFRLSYAVPDEPLGQGLEILSQMMR